MTIYSRDRPMCCDASFDIDAKVSGHQVPVFLPLIFWWITCAYRHTRENDEWRWRYFRVCFQMEAAPLCAGINGGTQHTIIFIAFYFVFFACLYTYPSPIVVQWLCQMTSLSPQSPPPSLCYRITAVFLWLTSKKIDSHLESLMVNIFKCSCVYLFVGRVRRRWNLRPWNNSIVGSGTATGIQRCRHELLVPRSSCDPGTVGIISPVQVTVQVFACTAAGLLPCKAEGFATPRNPGHRDSWIIRKK